MPDNPSPNQGWKSQGTPPAKKEAAAPAWKKEGGAPASGGPRAWQSQPATPAVQKRPRSKLTKGLIAFGTLGILAGAVVWVILLLKPPKPACLVVLGSSYDVNLGLPHNVYGWKGLMDLRELADDTGFVDSWFSGPTKARLAYSPQEEAKDRKSWDKLWAAAPSDFREKTVIFNLALHGGADARGPFFFLNEPRGQDRVYFQELLKDLRAKWSGKNIVLILEPAQFAAHWPSGMLHNDFVKKLKGFTKEINEQKILVICASDEDQVSWPSEELRRTVFSHYLIEGLSGAADADGNQRINAFELFDYVQKKVSAWAQSNRGAQQTPILLGGSDRAAAIDLVQIKEAHVERSDDALGRTFTPSNELTNAWVSCANLAKQIPSPAAYTPHLWRVYRDTLLRWEQLERAGDPTGKVPVLKSKAAALDTDIQRKARVDLASREITRALPLPAVLGLSAPWSKWKEDLQKEVDIPGLWQVTDKEKRQKRLQEVLTAKLGDELRDEKGKLLYDEMCRQLLYYLKDSRTVTSPVDDLGPGGPEGECRARALARLFDERFNLPVPAEVHYLVMLLKDMDAKTPPKVEDLQRALDVRVIAEEAALAAPPYATVHSYSEVVLPWIQNQIVDADKDRRRAEDLLFGSSETDWSQARTLIKAAKDKYEAALKDAAVIREALDLRDRVLADLPYYARWLAERQIARPADQAGKALALLKQVEQLSKTVGDLAWVLDQLQFKGTGFHGDPGKSARNPDGLNPRKLMEKLTLQMKHDFESEDGLKEGFRKTCNTLREVHQAPFWHELQAALATPLIEDARFRMTLLGNIRGLSRKLHEGKDKFSQADRDPQETTQATLINRQMAFAVLVPTWQDKHPLATVADLPVDVFSERIAEYWKKFPPKVTEDLSASSQNADLKEAAEQLHDAEFLTRLLTAGAVPSWENLPFGPPEGMRRLRLHELLLWQAQRTVEDHWFSESREPYYVPAAKAYLQMAKDLAEAGTANELLNTARKKTAARFEETLKITRLVVTPPANPNWTTELRFPLTWKLDAEPGVPEGVPLCSLQMTGPLAAGQDPLFSERKAVSAWPTKDETYLLKRAAKPEREEDAQAKSKATLSCVYRGQRVESDIAIQLWRPDTLVNHFPPEKAGVVFRLAEGFDYGAISVVLDCSGSMVNSQKIGGLSRFEHAIKALDGMLKTVPENTYVSLLIFIQRERAEDTEFEWLRKSERWKASHREQLIADVSRLKFKGGASPIAEAIVKARDDGFPGPNKYQGPKLIVALTDGDDNYFKSKGEFIKEDDKQAQAAHIPKVAKYLQNEFENGGTEIHIVCFNDAKRGDTQYEELERAQAQFKRTVEDVLSPPGSFKIAPNPDRLATDLELAIRPKLRLQKGSVRVPGLLEEGDPIGAHGSEMRWLELEPDLYTAWVQKTKTQDFRLRAGDFMIVTLKRRGNDIVFERSLLASEAAAMKIAGETNSDWTASVLQNQISGKGDLVRHLVVIEEAADRVKGERALLQRSPGFVWLEVKPKDARPLRLVNWRRDYSFAGPALQVQSLGWPFQGNNAAPADLNVWWTANKYPENAAFSLALERIPAKSLKANFLEPDRVRVGNTPVRIEDVAIEDHEVAIGPGKKTVKPCLVVRLSHDAGKPAFVQLQTPEGLEVGEEHRYHSAVNKYTALFWNLPNPQKARFTLHLISLADFKRSTEPVIFTLPSPTNRPGPDPVPLAVSP